MASGDGFPSAKGKLCQSQAMEGLVTRTGDILIGRGHNSFSNAMEGYSFKSRLEIAQVRREHSPIAIDFRRLGIHLQ